MKRFRYSLVCLLGGLLVLCTGCQKAHETVVNTKSGVVINSSDFADAAKKKVASTSVNSSKVTSSGNVIHLGGGYENVELGSVFQN